LIDDLYHWLSRRLPRRLVYWVGLRILADATRGDRGPRAPAFDEVRLWDELDRWR
jgi:hypothetical protein